MQNRRRATARALLTRPAARCAFQPPSPGDQPSAGPGELERTRGISSPPPTPSFSCESNRALGLVCKTNCLGSRQSRVAPPPSDAQGKPSHSPSHPHSRVCTRHLGLPLSRIHRGIPFRMIWGPGKPGEKSLGARESTEVRPALLSVRRGLGTGLCTRPSRWVETSDFHPCQFCVKGVG